MNINKILTHNGRAHKDDFLSCCLLAYKTGAPIKRVDWPTEQDFLDKNTCVVDIGKKYDVKLLNFDHHQINGGKVCAFTLLLDYFNMRDYDALPWIEFVETYDHCGAVEAMKSIGSDNPRKTNLLFSPIENVVIQEFSEINELFKYQDFYKTLELIGKSIVDEYLNYHSFIKIIQQNSSVYKINGYNIMDMTKIRTEIIYSQAANHILNINKCNIVLSKNDRGEGHYRVTRRDDSIDFNNCKNILNTKFIHQNGFICNFDSTNILIDLEKITRVISGDQLNLSFE